MFAQLRTPFWYELNDNWADRVPVDLHKGWNEVLVKVGKGRGTASGFYGFTFRVADARGATLSEVVASTSPDASNQSTQADDSMRWYRIEVPPGCVAVVPPVFHGDHRMLLDGQEVHARGSAPIDLREGLHGEKNSLVIIARKDDPLTSPILFVTGATPFSLKPWTQTGLANFSGTAVYTRTFNAPKNFRHKRILLDLGRVSSVADVFVNGQHAGTLVWRPYRVDISKLIRSGANEIKILVTNTEANRRAVGSFSSYPGGDRCLRNGRPSTLIPYVDQVITLHPTREASRTKSGGEVIKALVDIRKLAGGLSVRPERI